MLEVVCPNCKTSFKVGDGKNGTLINPKELDGTAELVADKIRNENKGKNKMAKDLKNASAEELIKALYEKGVSLSDLTDKKVEKKHDPFLDKVWEDGYAKNDARRKLITAQTMHALGWFDGINIKTSPYSEAKWAEDSWQAWLDTKSYNYQFKVMGDELKTLAGMERKGHIMEFERRSRFFNKTTVIEILSSHIMNIKNWLLNDVHTGKTKGQFEYIKFRGKDYWKSNIIRDIICPLNNLIWGMKSAKDYTELYKLYMKFISRKQNKLWYDFNRDTSKPKIKLWVDTYKGAGAYYAMDNLIKYSGLKLTKYNNTPWYDKAPKVQLDKTDSLVYLESEVRSIPVGQRYKLLGLLKQSLIDCNFNFSETIKK